MEGAPRTVELNLTILQYISYILSITTLVVLILRYKIEPDQYKTLRFPIMGVFVHLVIYYTYYILALCNGWNTGFIFSGAWSGVIRIHMITTILSLEIYWMAHYKRVN